jgi:hypothetical protein
MTEPCTQTNKLAEIHSDVKEIKDMMIEDRVKIAKLETKINFFAPLIAFLTGVVTWFAKGKL